MPATPSHRERARPSVLSWRRAFDTSFLVFAGITAGCGALVWLLRGQDEFRHAVDETVQLALYIVPRVGGALLMAAFLQILVPREIVARLIGERAGLSGILVATVAGALTPGGPLTSFPIVVALYAAGAGKGALVAYITSWAMLGMQRVLVWEYPLLGADFTLLRLAASAALPVIAGAAAHILPIAVPPPPAGRR